MSRTSALGCELDPALECTWRVGDLVCIYSTEL